MGRSCRPFGKQIRFACTACCWCQGARIAVATCAMPFSTCLKRDVNGGALPKDFETRLIPPPRRSRCTAARDDRRQITAGCGLPASARQLTEFPEICSSTLLHLLSAGIGTSLNRPTAGPVLIIVPGSWVSADIRKSLCVASSALPRLWSLRGRCVG